MCNVRAWAQQGSLSIGVFEQRTLTGSEPFSLSISFDATKFVWLSVFTLIETICARICSKSRPRSAKSQLPVDARRSIQRCCATLLLKLPNGGTVQTDPTLLRYADNRKKEILGVVG